MNIHSIGFALLVTTGLVTAACSPKNSPVSETTDPKHQVEPHSVMAQAPCIIYKTKADYSRQVPVILSADKSSIVSYPDVMDVRKQGEGVYPVQLSDGFWLDNRGIGPGVAFLDLTYDEFVALPVTPDAGTLFGRILDNDPLVEMYQCGSRHGQTEMVDMLNGIIASGKWNECKKLK